MTVITNHQQRVETAIIHHAILSEKYRVDLCTYDETALSLICTEKELGLICKQLKCSGIYAEKTKVGIITNFGYY